MQCELFLYFLYRAEKKMREEKSKIERKRKKEKNPTYKKYMYILECLSSNMGGH